MKAAYTNPQQDPCKREFLSPNDKKFKLMMTLFHDALKKDTNAELKYCSKCHTLAETRAGARLHKSCPKTFTSKQILGIFLPKIIDLKYFRGHFGRY